MKDKFFCYGVIALYAITAVVLLVVLSSCNSIPVTGSVKVFSVKVDGATRVMTVSGLSETLLRLSEGEVGRQVTINVKPGYDLTVVKIEGCILYLYAKTSGFSSTVSGGICLREPPAMVYDLRAGKIPPPIYAFLGEDPSLTMQFTGEDGWLKTEDFDFVRLIQVMDRYQKSQDAQLIAIYNHQVTFLLVKVSGVCLWRLQVMDGTGKNLAQGNLLQCGMGGVLFATDPTFQGGGK